MGNSCICWLRGSTDKQEIESQRVELTELATTKYGFKQEDIIYIGKAGASAIKQNDLYQQEVDELISTLDKDKSIKFCFVWEISRLARVELAFYKLKNYFVENKVQLVCCVPAFKLFEDDGTINPTTEITLSVLITLASQEMKIKGERYRRARERNRRDMKWNGGGFGALYGYEVNPDGYIVPCKEEADNVNLIYRLYSTGNYSARKLTKELGDRGYLGRGGVKFTTRKVQKILSEEAYKGGNDKRRYIPIVDPLLWLKCKEIRQRNDATEVKATKETKHIRFGVKHLRCRVCGGSYFGLNTQYKCIRHHRHECTCADRIDINTFDNLIWDVAQIEHIEFLMDSGEKSIEGYEEQKKVLEEKIIETNAKFAALDERKFRIQDLYMQGDITKARYDSQRGKIIADSISYQAELERYHEEIERIDNIIYQIQNPSIDSYIDIVADVQDEEDRRKIKSIIDQHIGKCYIQKCEVNGYKGTEIVINTIRGIEHKFAFCYGVHKVFKYNSTDKKWQDYYPSHEESRKKAEKFYEEMGTTLEEISEETIIQGQIEDIMENPDLSDKEKTFLVSALLGKDIRGEK